MTRNTSIFDDEESQMTLATKELKRLIINEIIPLDFRLQVDHTIGDNIWYFHFKVM